MKNKFRFIIFSSTLLGIIIISVGFTTSRYFEITKNLEIFTSLYKEVNELYVEEVNPNIIIKKAIDSMLESLDPYTTYIPENEIEDFRTQNTGQYAGIGAYAGKIDDQIKITMIFEGYSAQKNGLKIGDRIIEIDGIDVTQYTVDQATDLLKGQVNTKVSMKVERFGVEDVVPLRFTREKIKIKSVPYAGIVSENIGYIKLTEFTKDAAKLVKNELIQLQSMNISALILDLRDNPGGLLQEAINVTNLFIPKDKEVVTTKGKAIEDITTYKTNNQPIAPNLPLTVLISEGSASASEIVSGTLQDYDRAVIVGQKSFGKGLVQVTKPIPYNSQLKVTIAKYYTPSGRCIQAIDYAKRNSEGKVNKFADSLKTAFKTSNNRVVYDGTGIYPDILITNHDTPNVVRSLYNQGHIFEFATKYYYENQKIQSLNEFSFSDDDYETFLNWLRSRNFDYEPDVTKKYNEFKQFIQKENPHEDFSSVLDDLEKKLSDLKSKELKNNKEKIKKLLERNIITRYFLQQGAIQYSLNQDIEIDSALSVLNNSNRYYSLLNTSL